MSKEEKKNAAATQEPAEKVVTKYDLKVQRRKAEKEKEKRAKDVTTAVSVIILLALAALVLSFPIRTYLSLHKAYIKVGNENVTKVEFDYSYWTVVNNYVNSYSQYLSWFGLDVTKDLASQSYDGTRSWKDYFEEMTVNTLRQNKALKADAQAKGFTKDVTADYNRIVEQQKTNAKAAGLSMNKYLQQNFGSYATEARIKPFLEEALFVNAYLKKLSEDNTPDEAKVQAKYEEDPKSYDSVDYRIQQFDAVLPTEPTELADPVEESESSKQSEDTTYTPSDAEIEKAMSDARELATKALATVKTEGEQVVGISYATANNTIRDWLYDDARKAGNTTVLEDTSSHIVYTVAFEKKYRDETPTADVRIMVADTQEQAQEVYNTWNGNGATEENFIDLCNGKYAELAVAEDGLLQGITKNEDLYEELLDWIYAEGRKTGDCEVINVPDVASFVIYYVGESKPAWYHTIENDLRSTAVNDYIEQIKETVQVSDPDKNLNYLIIEEEESKAAAESAAAESVTAENSDAQSSEAESTEGEEGSSASDDSAAE